MTNSEIIKEMQDNWEEIQKLIKEQNFKVQDAYRLLNKYTNIIRCAEDLEKSRDNWKKKYMKLKEDKFEQEKENDR